MMEGSTTCPMGGMRKRSRDIGVRMTRKTKRNPKIDLRVIPIDHATATEIIVKRHYLHRRCPISKAFALVDSSREIYGVVTYGVPCSSTLLKGVCGVEEQHNVYELNRLYIDPEAPENAASFLVGRSLRMLDREIIVSFADTSVGHVGYVYQATNFLYCGLSAQFKDPVVEGQEGKHHATFAHGMTKQQVADAYGEENVTYVERARKHRYVYFNASKKRRKALRKKLRYEVLPYPKGDSAHAEADSDDGRIRYYEQLKLF